MNTEAPQNPPATETNAAPARRRSSGLMPAFEGLQQQKNNDASAARRQSLSDQQAKGGVFSQLFHNNFGRNSK